MWYRNDKNKTEFKLCFPIKRSIHHPQDPHTIHHTTKHTLHKHTHVLGTAASTLLLIVSEYLFHLAFAPVTVDIIHRFVMAGSNPFGWQGISNYLVTLIHNRCPVILGMSHAMAVKLVITHGKRIICFIYQTFGCFKLWVMNAWHWF